MCRPAARLARVSVVLLIGAAVSGYCLAQPSPGQGVLAQAASASWVLTGNLNTARFGHTATLLANGKVLVVGGSGTVRPYVLDSAELYDPATGAWSVTGHLNIARVTFTATLLPNGKVLVAGGGINDASVNGETDTAELYDPGTGIWSLTGKLTTIRSGHAATLLQNGKVLVAGGFNSDILGSDTIDSAELYDPASGTWSPTGALIDARYGHTATLLPSGKVLVVGGSNDGDLDFALATAELYDPVSGTWSSTGRLSTSVIFHTATLLPSGKVLVAGGYEPRFSSGISNPTSLDRSELYDPATGAWNLTGSLNTARHSHTATLLPNGIVLVAGGYDWNSRSNLNSAERYAQDTASWASTSSLNAARYAHTGTLLPDGRVLVAGGAIGNPTIFLDSAELYQPEIVAANNSYRMTALFSDQAGLYQYIQLRNLSGSGPNQFAGFTLTITLRSGVVKQFKFPNDPGTGTQPLCIATANVWPTPSDLDFVIPNGFVPTDGGTIDFAGVDSWTFGPLAASGSSSLSRNGNVSASGLMECSKFSAGLTVPIDPVIEYYSAALDHYFISASQPDLDALDSGRIPGWKRTGYGFSAWITRAFDPLGGFSAPPNLLDVCRLYIPPVDGDSHFFSASAAECAAAQARYPEFVFETASAFLATLPDMNTGACPAGQTPVYRVWNGRADSNHRYTTSLDVRNQMKARGYIAEGYGPDAVAMCVAGNI
jgi:N-acetylneuraminic acid mutarotase